jgi:chromosomal replication initiation ATPase DnaA
MQMPEETMFPRASILPYFHGWLLGSLDFVSKVRNGVGRTAHHDEVASARRLSAVGLHRIQSVVAVHFGAGPQSFRERRGESVSRDVAAWLARELTSCTLRELAGEFGLGHPDSVRNLTRRIDSALPDSHKLRQDIAAIRRQLLITERT